MQMSARTPAMTALTAMTLDHLSGGRFIVGIGASGPQVVEVGMNLTGSQSKELRNMSLF